MQNFTLHSPTKIIFGRATLAELKNLVPTGEKVLITYGHGSIKHSGVMKR